MQSTLWRRAGRASERLAIAVTAAVISPWSFWLLFALCLLQLVSAKIATDVLYISNDIQLLLLPLLGISGTVSAAAAARQARRDHDDQLRAWRDTNERIDQILARDRSGAANAVRGEDSGEDSGAKSLQISPDPALSSS